MRTLLYKRPTFSERMAFTNTNPDHNETCFRLKKGEFSVFTEIAFDRHLKALLRCPKIQPPAIRMSEVYG